MNSAAATRGTARVAGRAMSSLPRFKSLVIDKGQLHLVSAAQRPGPYRHLPGLEGVWERPGDVPAENWYNPSRPLRDSDDAQAVHRPPPSSSQLRVLSAQDRFLHSYYPDIEGSTILDTGASPTVRRLPMATPYAGNAVETSPARSKGGTNWPIATQAPVRITVATTDLVLGAAVPEHTPLGSRSKG